MARILSIVYQPIGRTDTREQDRFVRVSVETARLIAGLGIEGDAKAGRHPRRQINLLSSEWLAARRREGYKTQPGDFGEQLIIEGLAVENLRVGERLQLGDHAWIEITQPRSGCAKLQAVQDIVSPVTRGNIGMLAKVIIGGAIRVGDPVRLVQHQHGQNREGLHEECNEIEYGTGQVVRMPDLTAMARVRAGTYLSVQRGQMPDGE